ncbi:beta strand repeat-containing protein [Sphingobacterium luzhongxinii]|uniref:beta strand repeat-containing protein n=2 Tax=Sphingobacterium TaxID=28453 RepID=UPI0013DB7080|nr:hypothetical protein [Sphingobacterium sp. xlx-183]
MKIKYFGLAIILTLMVSVSTAQQKLSDGTDGGGIAVNADAILDLASKNKGLLHTRVALESSSSERPLTAHVAGMMVYNTAKRNDVVPGIYYNNGVRWVLASAGTATSITYDPITFEISFIDQNGIPITIDFKGIVKGNETVTTFTSLGEGKYKYTSEDSTVTVINVPADIIQNFEDILNNTDVTNQITELIKEIGGNVYYDGTTLTYLDDSGVSQTMDISTIVKGNETVTTFTSLGEGKYKYTSEDSTVTVINVPADIIQNFEDILNNTDVTNQITELIKEIGGNVYYDGTTLTYLDDSGVSQTMDISTIVKGNETVTTFTSLGEGKYKYTSEDSTVTVINVPADIIQNFEDILNNTDVTNQITELIKEIGGNVYYDGTTLTYLDDSGVSQTMDISTIVKGNETVTTFTSLGEGKYKYTSEDSTVTVINVVGDVTGNAGDIFSNTDVVNEIKNLISGNETLTSIVYDATAKTLTYKDEDSTATVLNLIDLVGDAETVTTFTSLGEGKYKYTSEDSTVTVINVVGDVTGNAGDIFSNTDVVNEIKNLISGNETLTSIVYDATAKTLTYKDEDGTATVLNLVDNDKQTITDFSITENTLSITLENGNTKTVDLSVLSEKTVLAAGVNATLTGTGIATSPYVVDVATANGETLGVVKQAATNPSVTVVGGVLGVNQSNVSVSGEVTGSLNSTIIADNVIDADNLKLKAVPASKLDGTGAKAGHVATVNIDGTVSYKEINPSAISGRKNISSTDGIRLTGTTTGSVLEDIAIGIDDGGIGPGKITPGINGQILTVDATSKVVWKSKADLDVITGVSNTSINNNLTTSVNGTTGTAVNIINSNKLELNGGHQLYSTVNGVATSPAVDLSSYYNTDQQQVLDLSMTLNKPGEISLTLENGGGEKSVSLISTDAKNQIVAGTDGKLHVSTDLINYSTTEQATGRKWIGDVTVYERTLEVILNEASTFITLPSANRPTKIIGVRFINRSNNAISSGIMNYDSGTGKIIFGSGLMAVTQQAGTYDLILEYTR